MPLNESRIITDDLGRRIAPLPSDARLVSLVPSITELLCDLGAAEQLVGVSRFCTHPPAVVGAIEKVGGTKDPDCERIAALRPDIVFVDRDENRREDFDHLTAAGLPIFVAHPRTVPGVARTVTAVGQVIGRADTSTSIAAGIEAALSPVAAAMTEPVRVFCPIWRNPWMSFNQSTYAADLLRQAGGVSVCHGEAPYPVVRLDEIAEQMPEVILLPDEPYVFRAKHVALMDRLSDTPAWQSSRIHLVDGKAMFWYGARTPGALKQLRILLL